MKGLINVVCRKEFPNIWDSHIVYIKNVVFMASSEILKSWTQIVWHFSSSYTTLISSNELWDP